MSPTAAIIADRTGVRHGVRYLQGKSRKALVMLLLDEDIEIARKLAWEGWLDMLGNPAQTAAWELYVRLDRLSLGGGNHE